MTAPIVGIKVGMPEGWLGWDGGLAHEQVDDLVAPVVDPERRETLRQLILDTDAKVTAVGLVVAVAIWVPDIDSSGALAVMRAELRTGDPAQPLTHEALLDGRTHDPMRGYQVFDRTVVALEIPAGPAVAEVTVLAERRGGLFRRRPAALETRITYSVTPPESHDVAELEFVTFEPALLDALVEAARAMASSLQVRVGEAA